MTSARAQLRRTVATLARARARRDDLIRQLRREGMSLRQLAELAEVSHTQVAKIVAEDEEER